ncbi:MAG TPA: hypothetical protein VID29_01450 [Solirubrobacteraceae bacterium]
MDRAPERSALEDFLAGAPWTRRAALRTLLALARRPRGAALLDRIPMLAQAGRSLLEMGRYEDPALARSLGWDAEAVVARGRALRRAEGRP